MEGKMDSTERSSGQTESAESAESADLRAGAAAGTETAGETRGARFARKAHRTRLYLYAGAGHVRISWVFGASSVSLVWLVLFSAILGLLLGMVLGALFHWRTRMPRS
jgi:hypothetical protein